MSETALTSEETDDRSDRVAELKAKYNSLLLKAKDRSRDGDVEGSLKLYKKAYKIHKNAKVAKKIEKLEVKLQLLLNYFHCVLYVNIVYLGVWCDNRGYANVCLVYLVKKLFLTTTMLYNIIQMKNLSTLCHLIILEFKTLLSRQ